MTMWDRLRRLRTKASDAELHRAVLGSALGSGLAGATEAMAELYRRHGGLIYRFTLRMSRDTEVAEEITQEVFLALLRRPEGFDAERAGLGTWLCGIARRQLWKHYEKTGRLEQWDDEAMEQPDTDGDGPIGQMLKHEAVTAMHGALDALPAELREVIVLCVFEEMSYEEAAQVMTVQVGTVRSRLHRAKARLGRMLRGEMAAAGGDASGARQERTK